MPVVLAFVRTIEPMEVRPVGVHLLVRREQGECVVTCYQFRCKEWSLDGFTGSIEQEMPIHWIDHNPGILEPDSLSLWSVHCDRTVEPNELPRVTH